MTYRVEAPPAPGSGFRSVHVKRVLDDGSTELVCVAGYIAVDGKWIDRDELIEAWRQR